MGARGRSALHQQLLDVLAGARDRIGAHPSMQGPYEQRDLDRWLSSVLFVAAQTNLWARAEAPRFVDVTGPTLRWGGDNGDATYAHVALGHERTYRVRVRVGTAVYSSLTVYGGPRDGHYSTRIVGTVRADTLPRDGDGWAELLLGPDIDPADGLRLAPDTEVGLTRDYFHEAPARRTPTQWAVEVVDGPADPGPDDDVEALRRTVAWLEDQVAIPPVALEPNVVQPPYPVPEHTFGWAAGDASYAMGAFDLGPGEELLLQGRSPACTFWNVCLWNPLLHGYDSDDGTPTSLHDRDVELDADGGWTIRVGTGPRPGPNALSTQGRTSGLIWFRWFLPDATPDPITATVRSASAP